MPSQKQQKCQNRKLILQQLLQKSQLFQDYLQNQQHLHSILNLTNPKNHQFLQFGKCQINLPEKVRGQNNNNKFTTNKIMVLTKNKKQAIRIKEKYENLQKLRETQVLNLDAPQQQYSQRKRTTDNHTKRTTNSQCKEFINGGSSKFTNTTDFTTGAKAGSTTGTPTTTNKFSNQFPHPFTPNNHNRKPPNNPQSYQFMLHQQPIPSSLLSPQRQSNMTQLKCKTKQFITKNRSSSAKVRPQFDFFLKYANNFNQQAPTTGQGSDRYAAGQELISQRKITTGQTGAKTPKYSSHRKQLKEQPLAIEKQQKTQQQQQPTPTFTSANLSQPQNPLTSIQLPPTILPNSPERRPSSFSIKKHPTNITPSLLVNKNYQQNLQETKKNQINFRRQLHKTYKRAFIPPPKISAKAYAVYEVKQQAIQNSGKILCTINGKMAQQVASLTKIMTCIVVLQIAQKFACNLDQEMVEIGKFQTNITGTSASLKTGQIYSIQQLLYGLMLPSGNDASLALGVWGGKVLLTHPQVKTQATNPSNLQTNRTYDSSQSLSPVFDPLKKYFKKDYIQRFVQEMNKKAQTLNMTRTHYANTHGLVNSENKSAAIDIALLCEYVMENQKFAQICGTKLYESVIKFKEVGNSENPSSVVLKPRQIKFQNTHYLLHKKPHEYLGIKTGVTTAAGPCLTSYIENKESNRKFIIVVLDCKSMMMRFKETEILKKWLYKQENIPVKAKKLKSRAMSLRQDHSEIRSELEETEGLSDGEEDFADEKCED